MFRLADKNMHVHVRPNLFPTVAFDTSANRMVAFDKYANSMVAFDRSANSMVAFDRSANGMVAFIKSANSRLYKIMINQLFSHKHWRTQELRKRSLQLPNATKLILAPKPKSGENNWWRLRASNSDRKCFICCFMCRSIGLSVWSIDFSMVAVSPNPPCRWKFLVSCILRFFCVYVYKKCSSMLLNAKSLVRKNECPNANANNRTSLHSKRFQNSGNSYLIDQIKCHRVVTFYGLLTDLAASDFRYWSDWQVRINSSGEQAG